MIVPRLSICYTSHIDNDGHDGHDGSQEDQRMDRMIKAWIVTIAITLGTYQLTDSALLAVFVLLAIGIYFSLEVNKAR